MAKKIKYNNSDEVVVKYAENDTKGRKLSTNIDNLQDQINNLKALGRFLSTWNCVTGLPETAPTVLPYAYVTGDYFVVGTVSDNVPTSPNYRPHGTVYSPVPSTTIETSTVHVNDFYKFDGTDWVLIESGQMRIVFSQIAGDPYNNTALKDALDAKLNLSGGTVSGAIKLSTNGAIQDAYNNNLLDIDESDSSATKIGNNTKKTKVLGNTISISSNNGSAVQIDANKVGLESTNGVKITKKDAGNTNEYGHILKSDYTGLTGNVELELPNSGTKLVSDTEALLSASDSVLSAKVKLSGTGGIYTNDTTPKDILKYNSSNGTTVGNSSKNTTIVGNSNIITESNDGIKVIDAENANGYGHVLNPNKDLTGNVVVNLPSDSGTIALTKDVVLTETDSTLSAKLKLDTTGGIYSSNNDDIVKYDATDGVIFGDSDLATNVNGSNVSLNGNNVNLNGTNVNVNSSGNGVNLQVSQNVKATIKPNSNQSSNLVFTLPASSGGELALKGDIPSGVITKAAGNVTYAGEIPMFDTENGTTIAGSPLKCTFTDSTVTITSPLGPDEKDRNIKIEDSGRIELKTLATEQGKSNSQVVMDQDLVSVVSSGNTFTFNTTKGGALALNEDIPPISVEEFTIPEE